MPEKKTAGRKGGKAVSRAAKKPARKPKAPPAKKAEGRTLRVKQVRSGIGHAFTYRRTLVALGLSYHQKVVTLPDNPSVRGMLTKVRHLVSVVEA